MPSCDSFVCHRSKKHGEAVEIGVHKRLPDSTLSRVQRLAGARTLDVAGSRPIDNLDGGESRIMFKAFVVGILIGVVLVAAGAWFYFTTGWAPVAVSDPPMLLEKKLAHGALNARIGKDPHSDPAPVAANEATYLAGADVYKQNCAVCHGLPGEAQNAIAKGMFPKPPELFHGTGVTDDPAWETYWKAKNGIRLTGWWSRLLLRSELSSRARQLLARRATVSRPLASRAAFSGAVPIRTPYVTARAR